MSQMGVCHIALQWWAHNTLPCNERRMEVRWCLDPTQNEEIPWEYFRMTRHVHEKNKNKKQQQQQKKKQEKNKVTETEIFKYLTKFSLLAAPELSVQPVMEKKNVKMTFPFQWLNNRHYTTKQCECFTLCLYTIKFMMTSSNGNFFRITGHLYGEFTGSRWIPRTKASDAELWCFLWSASE